MRVFAPVLASAVTALLLFGALILLDRHMPELGASAGAAFALAAAAAFLLSYDIIVRQSLGASSLRGTSKRKPRARPIFDPQDITIVDAASQKRNEVAYIDDEIPAPESDAPVALRIMMRVDANFAREHLQYQVAVFAKRRPSYPYVYFTDKRGVFVAFAKAKDVVAILENFQDGQAFIGALNNDRADALLLADQRLVTETIENGQSAEDALAALAKRHKTEAMIVHAESRRPIGIADWASLVLSLLDKRKES